MDKSTKVRDHMVHLCDNVKLLFTSAYWTVSLSNESEAKKRGLKLIDGLCGYEIDNYEDNGDKFTATLIPAMKGNDFCILVITQSGEKLFSIPDPFEDKETSSDITRLKVSVLEYLRIKFAEEAEAS